MYQTMHWMFIFLFIFCISNVNSKSIATNNEDDFNKISVESFIDNNHESSTSLVNVPQMQKGNSEMDPKEIIIFLFILSVVIFVLCALLACIWFCCSNIFKRLKRTKSRGNKSDVEKGLNHARSANSSIPLNEYRKPTNGATIKPTMAPLSSQSSPKALPWGIYNPSVNHSSNNLKNKHTVTTTTPYRPQSNLYPQLPTSDDEFYQPSPLSNQLYQAKNLSNPAAAKMPTFEKAKLTIISLWKVGCLDLKLRNFGNYECASASIESIYNNPQHRFHKILVAHVKQIISHGLQKWKNNHRSIENKHLNKENYFLYFNPETREITGRIAGNIIFETSGKDNSLSKIGVKYLNDINDGKIENDAVPFYSDHSANSNCNLDFYVEREKCLREEKLFEDPEFPINDDSLYFCKSFEDEIVWLRPWEFVDKPQFFVDGEDRFDVCQGRLGNCWFVAGAAILALRKELFFRVVKPDQSFSENYAGIFHFQFWRYNEWVDVVIDDRLPTVRGKLHFMHSECKREMWSSLLEKAYAKLYGSYEALDGGFIAEALQDLTGGLTDHFKIKNISKTMLSNGYKMGTLFGFDVDPEVEEEETGLLHDHAYSITARHIILEGPHKGKLLLRVRNPHGNEGDEWIGAFSDEFPEWLQITEKEKRRMKFVNRRDGEFWLLYEDCWTNFDTLECCHLKPEFMDKFSENKGIVDVAKENVEWISQAFHGEWNNEEGTTGGCKDNEDTFADNPQYCFSLSAGTAENNNKSTVIIALMQKFRRELLREGLESIRIGFAVYKLNSPIGARICGAFFEQHDPIAEISHFYDLREATARFCLSPGHYLLVPSTEAPEDEAEYLLRMFSNTKKFKAQQLF